MRSERLRLGLAENLHSTGATQPVDFKRYEVLTMYRLLALLFALVSITALADSPPSYSPFESKSENSKFIAKVDVENRMGQDFPREWKYNIKVFDVAAMSKSLWESEYKFDGYSDGTLSNDGSYFAYVQKA